MLNTSADLFLKLKQGELQAQWEKAARNVPVPVPFGF